MASLPYERITSPSALHSIIRLFSGERLLVLQPFGWSIDGSHIPNAPEQFELDYVCQEHSWKVVCDFGPYVAVVREMTELDKKVEAFKRTKNELISEQWPISKMIFSDLIELIDALVAERDERNS